MVARAGLDEVFVLAPMASVVTDRPRMPHEVLERQLRAFMTMTLLREVRALRAAGITVTVLTPGPQDLAVMGVNLMDPRRRRQVFETSLITSAATLTGTAGRAAVA
jgi:NTE family protein